MPKTINVTQRLYERVCLMMLNNELFWFMMINHAKRKTFQIEIEFFDLDISFECFIPIELMREFVCTNIFRS